MSAVGRHGQLAEGINLGLDDDIGEGNHGVLHPGGQSVADDLREHVPVEPNLPQLHREDITLPQQIGHAQHHAPRLGQHRGHRRRPDTPVEHRQEQPIQENVQQRGKNQVIQRPAAVPQGVDDAAADIVHHHRQGAQEVIAEILHRLRHHLRIRLHPGQEGGGQGHAHDSQNDSAYNAEGQHRVDGPGDLLFLSRAEIPGDDHPRPHGRAHDEADHQENQRAGGGDSRQGVSPQALSHDKGIRRVVQLLENLA